MEIEVKVPVPDLGAIRDRAVALAWPLLTPRHFEANTIFDYPDRSLGASGCLLRVRETPRGGLVTFKGRLVQHDQYKIRPEKETWCEDAEQIRGILQSVGFKPFFRYEKYREVFEGPDAHLCLDEMPFGNFLELEGTPEGIEAMAESLGLDRALFNRRTYADLYAEHCREKGLPFGDILFPKAE